ncbi:MAG: CAP domain-containing protein [Lachnospiraceae bacterium]|nr:CAP domain-containing protein [Lachnospiraceae bacterium]
MKIGNILNNTIVKRAAALILSVAVAFSSADIYAYADEYSSEQVHEHEHEHEHVTAVCTHDTTRNIEIQHATCVKPAVFNTICAKCGIIVKRNVSGTVVDRSNHTSFSRTVIKDSTDLNEGIAQFTCDDCGYSYTQAIAKKPCLHRRTLVRENISSATCTAAKTADLVCKTCGEILKDDYVVEDINPNNHSSFSARITKEPTYHAGGTREYTCDDCGYSYTEDIDRLVCLHADTTFVETSEATCVKAARGNLVCRECGDVVKENTESGSVNSSNHLSFDETITKAATYKEDGVKTFTCKDCGYSYTESITKLVCSHANTETIITVPANCVEKAKGKIICKDCDEVLNDNCEIGETDPDNHKNIEVTVTLEPTCLMPGEQTCTCTACGNYSVTEEIPAPGHNYESEITVEPTCSTHGEKINTCTVCGRTYTSSIAKLPHDYNSPYVITEEPTCTRTGLKTKFCSVCGEKMASQGVQKLPHTYEWVITTEATEEHDGLKEEKCTVCGNVKKSEVIPKIINQETCEHQFTSEVTVVPSCTKTGVRTDTCTICGLVKEEVLDCDPNQHGEFLVYVITMATYETTGLVSYTCQDCGYKYTKEIPVLTCPHSGRKLKYYSSTNEYWYVCKECGEKLEQYDPSNPSTCKHNYSKYRDVVKPATETEDGIVNVCCANCGTTLQTVTVHSYQEYVIELENGETETIYGYYLTDWNQQILDATNTYRAENGLNTLNYKSDLQDEADIRARECSLVFSHTRPNGTKWFTLNISEMNGENLASGYMSVDTVMNAWKNSPGHNANLLHEQFNSAAMSVFVRMTFTGTSPLPTYTYCYAQTFSVKTK